MNQESGDEQGDKSIGQALTEWMRRFKRLVVNEKRARFIIPLALLCVLAGVTLAQQTFQAQIANYGTIKVIGVSMFWDNACTSKVTSITWGTIFPGSSTQNYVYVRNDGTATETLSLSYGNWTPATASSYLVLTWNCSNYALSPNAVICANLTLTVQPNITGVTDFSFMILVQATG
jgi:hypothetical protein